MSGEDWASVLERDVEAVRRGETSRELVLEHEVLLLVLRAIGEMGRPIRVLDFGGGAATSYVWLRRAAHDIAIEYRIVEQPITVALGERLFAADPQIRFTSEIHAPFAPDVVFAKSVLQYIDDYRAMLRTLFGLGARYVVLEKFAGVDGDSYASVQLNVPGSSMAYWFISFEDVFAEATAVGYERALWRRLPRVYPQDDIPESRRMGQASTLVFRSGDR